MSQIYHSNIFTTVSRMGTEGLLAQTTLLSTGYEAGAKLYVAVDSFVVSEASWEIYRSPGGHLNGGRSVAGLVGQEAYLGSGPGLRQVGQEDGELPRELLADCVKGIIQAETYLFVERGFANTGDYEDFWRDKYRNSCRRYSSEEGSGQSWFEFIAGRKWGGDCLFSRCKTAAVHAVAKGEMLANSSFIDSFHELSLAVSTVNDVITDCSAELVRVPHAVCRETLALLTAFRGKAFGDISSKTAAQCAGGPQGCNHLVDLVYHTAKTLRQAGDGRTKNRIKI